MPNRCLQVLFTGSSAGRVTSREVCPAKSKHFIQTDSTVNQIAERGRSVCGVTLPKMYLVSADAQDAAQRVVLDICAVRRQRLPAVTQENLPG